MLGCLGRPWEKFDPDRSDMRLQALCEYWESRKINGGPPRRGDLSPRKLKPWLPNMGQVDVIALPDRFRVRAMGPGCVVLAGENHKGKYLDECVSDLDRDEIVGAYRKCAMEREPVSSGAVYVNPRRNPLRIQRLYLPCVGLAEKVDAIFVAVYGVEIANASALRAREAN